jgi:hypothetical protein
MVAGAGGGAGSGRLVLVNADGSMHELPASLPLAGADSVLASTEAAVAPAIAEAAVVPAGPGAAVLVANVEAAAPAAVQLAVNSSSHPKDRLQLMLVRNALSHAHEVFGYRFSVGTVSMPNSQSF